MAINFVRDLHNKMEQTANISEREKGIIVTYTRSFIQEKPRQVNAKLIARIGISYKTLTARYPDKSKKEILEIVKDRFEHDDKVKDASLHREIYHSVYLQLPIENYDIMNDIKPMLSTNYPITVLINNTDYSSAFSDFSSLEDKKIPFAEKVIFGKCKTENSEYLGKKITVDNIGNLNGVLFTEGIDLYNRLGLFQKEDETMGKPIEPTKIAPLHVCDNDEHSL